MRHGYRDQAVKCPCYHHDDGRRVFCDGIWDGTSTSTYTVTLEQKKEMKKAWCKGGYEACPIYQAVCERETE